MQGVYFIDLSNVKKKGIWFQFIWRVGSWFSFI